MDRSTGAGGDGITTTGGTGQWFQQMLEGEEEAVDWKIQNGLEGGHGPVRLEAMRGEARAREEITRPGGRKLAEEAEHTVWYVLCTRWIPVTQSSGG